MAAMVVSQNDGNIRCNNAQKSVKNKIIKVHSPKIRLRLQEACDNSDKAKISTVKYSLNPEKSNDIINLKTKENKNENYLSETLPNRNKICQMDKIVFPSASDRYVDEKPPLRCLGEDSINYMTRSRGSLVVIGSGKGRVIPNEIHIRCPSKEAEDNLEKGRGLRMTNVLQHSIDFKEDQPVPRVRDEVAAEISRKHRGSSINNLFDPTSRQCQSAVMVRDPRCPTAEAMETWRKSRGDSMSLVMGVPKSTESAGPVIASKKRVKNENGEDFEPLNSAGMSGVMGSGGETFQSPVYESRTRLDGRQIAEKARGTLTRDIYEYNTSSTGPGEQPQPRVFLRGKEIAAASAGQLTKQLLTGYGQCPRDCRPKPRVTRYAHKIAIQSRGGAMKDALCPPRQAHSRRRFRSAHK